MCQAYVNHQDAVGSFGSGVASVIGSSAAIDAVFAAAAPPMTARPGQSILAGRRAMVCSALLSILGAALLGDLVGCGRHGTTQSADSPIEGVVVKVRIVKGGVPLKSKDDSGIPGMELIQPFQIRLVPLDWGSEKHQRGEYIGVYDESGTVTFVGPGRGVPPGIYRLVIVGSLTMPAGGGSCDPLAGRFNRENSPLKIVVTVANLGKEQDLGTIDLDHFSP